MADEVVRFDRAEFDRISTERQHSRARERRPELERLAQAEPAAKLLTDSEPWNQALSLMESKAKALEERVAQLTEKIAGTIYGDTDLLRHDQVQLLVNQAALDQLREVMELPAKMSETGQEAVRLLKDLDGGDEAT